MEEATSIRDIIRRERWAANRAAVESGDAVHLSAYSSQDYDADRPVFVAYFRWASTDVLAYLGTRTRLPGLILP